MPTFPVERVQVVGKSFMWEVSLESSLLKKWHNGRSSQACQVEGQVWDPDFSFLGTQRQLSQEARLYFGESSGEGASWLWNTQILKLSHCFKRGEASVTLKQEYEMSTMFVFILHISM